MELSLPPPGTYHVDDPVELDRLLKDIEDKNRFVLPDDSDNEQNQHQQPNHQVMEKENTDPNAANRIGSWHQIQEWQPQQQEQEQRRNRRQRPMSQTLRNTREQPAQPAHPPPLQWTPLDFYPSEPLPVLRADLVPQQVAPLPPHILIPRQGHKQKAPGGQPVVLHLRRPFRVPPNPIVQRQTARWANGGPFQRNWNSEQVGCHPYHQQHQGPSENHISFTNAPTPPSALTRNSN